MLQHHLQLSDRVFEKQFERGQLHPKLFNHQAHLRLAWIHIRKYELQKAIKNMCDQISRYTEALGAKEKFNTTLTVAATKAVYHFMQRSETDQFEDFIASFPKLQYNFKELMDAHYGIDIFGLEPAKKMFLEPDKLPFD